MKKFLLSVCISLCIITAPLAAFEWGGLFIDESGIITPDFSNITFKQTNGVSFWFNSPIGEDAAFNFSGEALYKYNMLFPKGGKFSMEHIVDLPLLKISGDVNTSNGILSVSAGRFSFVDKTSALYSNTCDGLSVDYALPLVTLGAYAGYTGALNALNVSMYSEKNNKVYNLVYPWIPLSAYVEFPALMGNQSLGIQGFAVIDAGSIKQNSYYANFTLSGPVANFIYYSLVTSVGSINFESMMNYTAFSIIAFPMEMLFLNAGVEYGSAEGQMGFSTFSSLASSVGGKLVPKVGFTFATGNMSFDFTGRYNLAYQGKKYKPADIEFNAGFVYNVFSDLQFGLTFKGIVDPANSVNNNYTGYLSAALAF